MENGKTKKASRAVIFDENTNKVAIIEVRGGEYYKIPGGAIEKGEASEDTAKREALEEAGCNIELISRVGEQEFVDPGEEHNGMIHYSICYLGKKIGEQKNPAFNDWEKNNEFKLLWVELDEAIELFKSSKTEDPFSKEMNSRDLEFLMAGMLLKDMS